MTSHRMALILPQHLLYVGIAAQTPGTMDT